MARYNAAKYNDPQYNADVQAWHQPLTETLTLAESLAKAVGKPLSDSVTASEAKVNDPEKRLTDGIFLQENVTKSVTNKGLADTVKLTDWVTVKRSPDTNNPWGD